MKAVCNTDNTCPDDSLEIDPVMFIETRILDSNKSMSHIFRNLIIGAVDAVGTGVVERLELITALVYDKTGVALRHDIFCGYFRGVPYDLIRKYTCTGNADDT